MKSNRRSTTPRVIVAPLLSPPTHQDIAAAAELLWIERGRPENQDEIIWLEAESRLRSGASAQARKADPLAHQPAHSMDKAMDDLDDLYPGGEGSATTSI